MKKIPLTQGKYALVDNEDYPIVSLFKWYATKNNSSGIFYADTKWFHEYILPYAKEIRFIKGRLKFGDAIYNFLKERE